MGRDTIKLRKSAVYLLSSGIIILLTQKISGNKSIVDGLLGIAIIIVIALIAILIKEIFPKSFFPAFGWVTILGFLISMPYNPLSEKFLEYVGEMDFMAVCTPLLAFAGMSVGNKINDLKKMSWKIVIVSVVVFITIFFACALIAHAVLKLTGKI